MKGETSGNTLVARSLHADCDGDTILALVKPTGPACHTGDATCFGTTPATENRAAAAGADVLEQLDRTLASRAEARPEGSYTVRLLDDVNLRLKKLGEETAELVAALATEDGERATEEAADLLYHMLVALRAEGVGLQGVVGVLRDRHG
jgi:phosphoribosyl-ATP pyrophosphohydrolase/phosphoribosyl-AMP cyclohydrolase